MDLTGVLIRGELEHRDRQAGEEGGTHKPRNSETAVKPSVARRQARDSAPTQRCHLADCRLLAFRIRKALVFVGAVLLLMILCYINLRNQCLVFDNELNSSFLLVLLWKH